MYFDRLPTVNVSMTSQTNTVLPSYEIHGDNKLALTFYT